MMGTYLLRGGVAELLYCSGFILRRSGLTFTGNTRPTGWNPVASAILTNYGPLPSGNHLGDAK